MDKMAKGGDDMILLIGGELTNGKREFSVPVDSTVQSIGVSVFLQCAKSITIVDSAGAQVAAGPQVEDATFHAGRLFTNDVAAGRVLANQERRSRSLLGRRSRQKRHSVHKSGICRRREFAEVRCATNIESDAPRRFFNSAICTDDG